MVLVLAIVTASGCAAQLGPESIAIDAARITLNCNALAVVGRTPHATGTKYEVHGCGKVTHIRCAEQICVPTGGE
jgi:hypothetical protein